MLGIGSIVRDKAVLAVACIAAVAHFAFALFIHFSPAVGSWQWFPVFVADFPVSILPLLVIPPSVPPLLTFGAIGSVWWFLLAGWAALLVRRLTQPRVGA